MQELLLSVPEQQMLLFLVCSSPLALNHVIVSLQIVKVFFIPDERTSKSEKMNIAINGDCAGLLIRKE